MNAVAPIHAKFRPITLAELAARESLCESELSSLADISKSTLSRVWHDSHWLDHVNGHTLQQLIASLPGLAQYVTQASLAQRFTRVANACQQNGLAIRPAGMPPVADTAATHDVLTALEAAVSLKRSELHVATTRLRRCWGKRKDLAVDALFRPGGLFIDATPLIKSAIEMVGAAPERGATIDPIGYGILVHKMTKIAACGPTLELGNGRHAAFIARNHRLAEILSGCDLQLIDDYRAQLQRCKSSMQNEIWALATFYGDVPVAQEVVFPNTPLTRTTREIAREIRQSNDAYYYYLLTVATPAILLFDRTAGGEIPELVQAIRARSAFLSVGDEIHSASERLVENLSR